MIATFGGRRSCFAMKLARRMPLCKPCRLHSLGRTNRTQLLRVKLACILHRPADEPLRKVCERVRR